MIPTEFKGQQTVLGAPVNWNKETHGECVGLPVVRTPAGFLSCWKPTLLERLKLICGFRVWLHVMTNGHPPVAMYVDREGFHIEEAPAS